MQKSKKKRFFKIVICIIIAISFWTLNKLSQNTIDNISFKINITELPDNLVVDSISTENINLKVQKAGSLKSHKNELNISAKNIKNNTLPIKKDEIYSQLETNFKIIDIYPDTIFLFTSKKTTRKIPIKHNIKINFSESYWQKNDIKIFPDSILIKGNTQELKKIKFLETEELKLFNVYKETSGFLNFKKNDFINQSMQIEFYFDVEKYTEGSIEIPIKCINFPKNKKVLLFPKKAKIYYLVSEEEYRNIRNTDFKVVCDFQNIDISTKICNISLLKHPSYIKIIRIQEYAEFLIE